MDNTHPGVDGIQEKMESSRTTWALKERVLTPNPFFVFTKDNENLHKPF
jgi:hypothetical protein